MTLLIAACAVFLGLHLGVSGTRLRGLIAGKIGKNAYLGLFALGVSVAFIWLCLAYGRAFSGEGNFILFDPSQTWRNFAIPVIGAAFFLGVPGILMANPTSAGQEDAAVRGVQKITRHPFLWGVAIWAAFHLVGTGDLASVILFASFLALALAGTRSIDAKCRKRLGESWQTLARATSNLPFAALLARRNRLGFKEYFDWRFWVAAADFAVFLYFHNTLFGMSPYPNDRMPPF